MNLTGTVTAEYNVPTPNSRTIQITLHRSHGETEIWFTENAANQIGRLTLSHHRDH